jgi:4-hydroxy-2-oxoheptanedioate aldolase
MTNPIKARLAQGETLAGVWLNLASATTAEIVGEAGYDWCLVDGEHGANPIDRMRDQLIALKAAGCPAALRVAENRAWMVKQALDAGAQTVVVPMVSTGEEARAAAAAMRYPPQGIRGMGAGVVRASGYGLNPDYMFKANDEVCLMVQAETRAAVDNIDAIAATPGVDAVFIGPSDLAADMGHMGDTTAPEVEEAIAHVMARTQAAGKHVGMFCLTPAHLPRYRDLGARFIAVASDVVVFASAIRARATEVREALKS